MKAKVSRRKKVYTQCDLTHFLLGLKYLSSNSSFRRHPISISLYIISCLYTVYHRWPSIQFVDFVSWRFCKNMSSQTLGLINIISYNLHRMNQNFVIDQSFLNPTFDSHWHSAKCLIWCLSPSQHFWWFLFQFCQDTLVGVLFKEWRQCFFVENAHSWSI